MVLALLVVLVVAAWSSVASATTSSVRSEPNGDLRVTVSAGSLTDRDRDGDFDTAVKNDIASLFFAVANQSAVTQTVTIDYKLDAPGTELDKSFTQAAVLGPGGIHQAREELRIRQKSPAGEYVLSVTGSGTETATAVATFTVR